MKVDGMENFGLEQSGVNKLRDGKPVAIRFFAVQFGNAIEYLATPRLIPQHRGEIGEQRRNWHVVVPVGLAKFQDGAVLRQKAGIPGLSEEQVDGLG